MNETNTAMNTLNPIVAQLLPWLTPGAVPSAGRQSGGLCPAPSLASGLGNRAAIFCESAPGTPACASPAPENDSSRTPEPNPPRESVGAGSQDDFVLRLYLHDMARFPRLAAHEESELVWLASFGEESARERLVLGNLRLVVHIALTYRNAQLPVSDLIDEGNLGLLRAAQLFSPTRGASFANYAAQWIRQRMQRALSYQAWPVRLPADFLWRNKASCPQPAPRFVSLDSPVGDDEDSQTLGETLPDEQAPSPADAVTSRSDCQFARRLLATLRPREQQVLRLRFGLEDGCERTLEEVGDTLGYVRQGIHRIESAALAKLRRRVKCLPAFASVDAQ